MTNASKQLPLMVSVGGMATDDASLPAWYALPVGSVSVTPEVNGQEDTLITGALVELEPEMAVRALVIRVEIPADHPAPRPLGEAWASITPGDVVTVTETYTDRRARTSYTNARVRANTVGVSRQASLTEAYYSGAIELRVLVEETHGL